MRRTEIALAAGLYIHAATINVVSALGVKQALADLEEFVDPVVSFADDLGAEGDNNKANDVVVFNSIGFPKSEGDGNDVFVADIRVVGLKNDDDGVAEKLATATLKAMAANGDEKQKENIEQRVGPFFAKALEGSTISMGYEDKVSGEVTPQEVVGTLDDDGNLNARLDLSGHAQNTRLDVSTNVAIDDSAPLLATSSVLLRSALGFGVISDIDDTIKVTDVLAKLETVKNTFIKDYTPEDGMPDFYSFLEKNITLSVENDVHLPTFYYLSGSPSQLFRPLQKFLQSNFPEGELILNDLNIRDVISIMESLDVEKYKLDRGRTVLKKFPQRKFLLIGDSGQKDPEVYGQLYREFPEQISCILIRKETGVDSKKEATLNKDSRFVDAFKDVPLEDWDLFDKGSDLTDKVDYQKACRR